MIKFMGMSQILFEDRTAETPEAAAHRRIARAAVMLAEAAFGLVGGDAQIAIPALAVALGQLAAATDAPLDEVLALVTKNRDVAQALGNARRADA
jgi:hypothetical protein